MTIVSDVTRVSFACNGVSTVFPVSIQAYFGSDFLVLLTNSSGVTSVLTENSDYTMAETGSLLPPMWTLTTQNGISLISPYATGNSLLIILTPSQTQLSRFVTGQAFPSEVIEQGFDRNTQMSIRMQDFVNRALIAPDGDTNPVMVLPSAVQRKLTYATFDANGNATVTGFAPPTQVNSIPTSVDSGVADALVATVPGFVLQTFATVWVRVAAANLTLTPTLNVSGTGAKTIILVTGQAPAPGTFEPTGIYQFMYDGAHWQVLNASQILQGFFVGTLTGMTVNPTPTINWYRTGNKITLTVPLGTTATSSNPGMTLTNLPAVIGPASIAQQLFLIPLTDNGTNQIGHGLISSGSATIVFGLGMAGTSNFTPSGTKGIIQATTMTYDMS